MKILIVDDEADIRTLLTLSLGLIEGAQIVEAADAAGAISLALVEQPDIIILDAIMPGVSGPEALPSLREASPLSQIYLFSAIAAMQLEAYGSELGVEVFQKTRIRDLIDEIGRLAHTA